MNPLALCAWHIAHSKVVVAIIPIYKDNCSKKSVFIYLQLLSFNVIQAEVLKDQK